MIRAASLFYALVVSLLLGVLLMSVILRARHRSMQTERWVSFHNARNNLYAAMTWPAEGGIDAQTRTSHVDLFGQGIDPVSITRMAWGVFELRTCSAFVNDQRATRTALMGWHVDPTSPSLWVEDQNDPIALAGDTRLMGPCYLPVRGLRRAYIEGRPYTGSLTLDDQRPSSNQFPELRAEMQQQCHLLQGFAAPENAEFVRWKDLPSDSVQRSFAEHALVVEMAGERHLSGSYLGGHIIIRSNDSLVIDASFTCDDLLIYAPFVTVSSGFHGRLQCLTTGGVDVGSDAELQYPSALVCNGEKVEGVPVIRLGVRTIMSGVILAFANGEQHVSPTVELSAGCTFTGEVRNEGAVQLGGTIEGCVIATSTVLRTPSSVYRGHIMDAVVKPLRDAGYLGVGVWGNEGAMDVLQWMDQ